MQQARASTRRRWVSAMLLLAVAGCSDLSLPPATGATTDVVLLVDTATQPDLGPLQAALAAMDTSLVPPEPTFLVSTRVVTGRHERPREKNVVVVGHMDSPGRLQKSLAPWLGDRRRLQLERHGGWLVLADVWARDQEVTLLLGRDAAGLDSLLQQAGAALRLQLGRSILARRARALGAYRDTPSGRELRRHGFALSVPPSYRRLPAVPEAAVIELACESPARLVTVFWRDAVGAEEAARDAALLALLGDVMRRLHGDTLVVASMGQAPTDPVRRVARGRWQNAADVAGGPFIAHFVYDGPRRRLYGVQAQLFAPGLRKRPFLVELEALLWSFQIEGRT